jgi:outer membrane protein, multidrug efflux system
MVKPFYPISLKGWAILLLCLTIPFAGGCAAVGPDYVPPENQLPVRWHNPLQGGLAEGAADADALSHWWRTLNDPVLSRLMEEAVTGNLDLKEARARVREARAKRGIEDAGLFPYVDASGKMTRSQGSEETGAGTRRTLYAAGFDAGWEVDIFGGIRRSVEAADADLQASQASLRDVLVTLTAEVGRNYVEMRAYQTRLAVARANLKSQEETYQLTQWRFQAGLSDALSVEQARYNLENTRSQVPTLRSGLEASLNRITVLLGKDPGQLHEELAQARPIPVTPTEVAVGIPADCIRRRPDIRKAERDLAAQTARIGVATAERYPRFSLLGSIGLEALSLGGFASSDGLTYSIGPTFSWPLFKAGAIRQNIQVQTALQEQAFARYESAVLTALEEVENSLRAYAEEQKRRVALQQASASAQQAAKLAQNKYEAGIIDFNEVLDAQRSQLSFEDQLAQSEGTVTTNLIALYKALGGGWAEMPAGRNNTGFGGVTAYDPQE